MSEFILAYKGTLRTYSAKEEAATAALLLRPKEHVDGVGIYEIEEAGYINRTDMLAAQKLTQEGDNNDGDEPPPSAA